MKKCSVCKVDKPITAFYRSYLSKDGIYPRCKDCDLKASRAYQQRNPVKFKEKLNWRRIKSAYGLSREEYERMSEEQGHVCKICLKKNKSWKLAVDHKHSTGKVRGLLCNQCNRGIGLLGDSVENIQRTIDYLTR